MSKIPSKREQDIQRKSIEFELLRQQSEAIQKQIEEVEMKRNELLIVRQSMNEIKGQSGKDILVPIGSGVFLKGQLRDDKKILVELGANVVAEKNVKEADKLIDRQLQEIEDIQNNMREELIRCVSEIQRLEPELVEYYKDR